MANAETAAESQKNFIKKQWEGYKGFWCERFSFLENYSRFIKRDKPLPSWSESDVEEFIASDPIHGPVFYLWTKRQLFSRSVATVLLVGICAFKFVSDFFQVRCGCGAQQQQQHTQYIPNQVGVWGSYVRNYTLIIRQRVTKRLLPLRPKLKTARQAAKYGAVGGLLGAVTTAGWAWKYSRSPHGAALSFAAGGIFGWTFGHEIANHHLQLYRMDTMAAQTKFMEWWEKKVEGH